jgi:hypothetical protein
MGAASSRLLAPPEGAAGAPVSPAPIWELQAPSRAKRVCLDEVALRLAEAVGRFPAKLAGPFMTGADVLNLATCAKYLRPYACEIVYLHLGTSSIERPEGREVLLLRKLAELKGLVTLHLSDRRLVSVVEQALKAGALRLIRRLDLTGSSIGDVGMRRLLSGLEAARRVEDASSKEWGLHELIVRQSLLTPHGVRSLAKALNRGVLPDLRMLDLSASPLIGAEGVKALAAAMGPGGGLGKLEHLSLADADIGWADVQALGKALLKHGCHELRVLDAMGTIDAWWFIVTTPPLLLDAIREGCVPKLRELRIGTTRAHPESRKIRDTEHILCSLEKGCSKTLEKLYLMGFKVDDAVAEEIAGILRDKGLETLQELHLGHADITEEGVGLISDALREGAAPAL